MLTEPQIAFQWMSFLQTALGGAIAIVAAYATLRWTEGFKTAQERRRLASALQGEIEAIGELSKMRRVRESLIEGKDLYQGGGKWDHWSYDIEEDYMRVYASNADKIGLFEAPLPGKIAKFYYLTSALMESLRSHDKHDWMLKDATFMLRSIKEDIEVLDAAEKLAAELVHSLRGIK